MGRRRPTLPVGAKGEAYEKIEEEATKDEAEVEVTSAAVSGLELLSRGFVSLFVSLVQALFDLYRDSWLYFLYEVLGIFC